MTSLSELKCSVCGNGGVQVICPGDGPVYSSAGHILLEKGVPDLNLCLHDAAAIGWPWPSETPTKPKRRRKSSHGDVGAAE